MSGLRGAAVPQRRARSLGPHVLVSTSSCTAEQHAPIFRFNELDHNTLFSVKMRLFKVATHQRKKVLQTQSLLLGGMDTLATPWAVSCLQPSCWHFPDFHALVMLERSPRNRLRPDSTPSVHPHYTLRPRALPTKTARPCSGLQDHESQGLAPLRGLRGCFRSHPRLWNPLTFLLWVGGNRVVRILTACMIREAQPCGLWPSLLGHAPVTALGCQRHCPEGDCVERKRRLRPKERERERAP